MDSFMGFASEVIASGVISAALLSIAAFLGKSKIVHLLNKDFERMKNDLQKELEKLKSDNQIALEAYKVSLISEAERKKAEQNVRTSVAIKFSEHQFNAVNAINVAYADIGQQALNLLQITLDASDYLYNETGHDNMTKRFNDIENRSNDLTNAIFSATFFMHEEEIQLLQNYDAFICGMVEFSINEYLKKFKQSKELKFSRKDFLALKNFDERAEYVRNEENKVTNILRSYADKFLKMSN